MTGPRTPHRLFVALWPGPELTRSLEQGLSPLRERAGADVVWQAPERLHLTLAFLGDRDPDEAATQVARIASAHEAPQLVVQGGGRFGQALWVGVTGAGLTALYQRLARVFGLPAGRFRGHVTVARSRTPRPGLELVAALKCLDLGSWTPADVRLVASRLGPDAEYRSLGRYPFAPTTA